MRVIQLWNGMCFNAIIKKFRQPNILPKFQRENVIVNFVDKFSRLTFLF